MCWWGLARLSRLRFPRGWHLVRPIEVNRLWSLPLKPLSQLRARHRAREASGGQRQVKGGTGLQVGPRTVCRTSLARRGQLMAPVLPIAGAGWACSGSLTLTL